MRRAATAPPPLRRWWLGCLVAAAAAAPVGSTGVVAQEADPDSTAEPRFAPRAAIAGMPGLYTRSRVTFFELPDHPHELQLVMLFPDRARIQLSASGADWSARQLEYRAGEECFFVAGNSATSSRLEASEHDELLLRLALRRALLLWPDDGVWSGAGARRTTEVGELGSLVVTLDDAGRPTSMHALDNDGTELDAYSAIEWDEHYGRRWPRAMDFAHRGTPVWREERLELGVRPNFLDWFFLPADRRPEPPVGIDAAGAIRNTDLPPVVVRRIELAPGLNWEALLERAVELVESTREELRPRGLAVEDPVNFVVGADGVPTHCELRLATAVDATPEGWLALAERPALTEFGAGPPPGPGNSLAAWVGRLRARVPAGSEPGLAYLRAHPRTGLGGRLQLVLPLVP